MFFVKFLLLCSSIFVPISGNNPKAFLKWYGSHKKGSMMPVPEVDCDWVLPDAGLVKKSYTVFCPSNCLDVNHCIRVKGSGPYTVNSPVCLAAIHAGVLNPQTGGGVEVLVREGQKDYLGSVKHGVGAIAYSEYFASFTVKKSDVECKKDKKPVPCRKDAKIDLVFVADSSLSVREDNFNLEKKFISDLVHHFPIGPHQTRVGLVTFNDKPKTRFGLDQFTNKGSLMKAIFHTDYESGGTYVGKALYQVIKTMKFRPAKDVHKIVIVFTDGRSFDYVANPVKALVRKGAQVISFGIANIYHESMLAIANGNKNNVFSAESYNDLKHYVTSLISRICLMTLQPNE